MIRQQGSPRVIEIHFVKIEHNPTGHAEPLFPPVFVVLANALNKDTRTRYYEQPYKKGTDIKRSEE